MSAKQVAQIGAQYETEQINNKGVRAFFRNVRLTFVRIDRPSNPVSGDPKFGLTVMIPKQKLAGIQKALAKDLEKMLSTNTTFQSAKEKETALRQALAFAKERSIFKDGDVLEKYESLRGHAYFQANLKAKEGADGAYEHAFDINLRDVRNNTVPKHRYAELFYSGAWADVLVNFVPYNYMGQGITCYLAGVQHLAHDEKFGGSSPFSAREDLFEEDFETEFETESVGGKKKGKK